MNADCTIIQTLSSSVRRDGSNVIKTIRATSNALKEISILRAIEHDQIIKLNDFYLGAEIKLIMTCLPKVPSSLPINIFYTQCLKILTVLENLNIVHLDFREENLAYDGEKIILLDFGSAVLLREGTLISNSNYPPEYIRAPEINSFYISKVDSRTDVWSLGALVYNRIYNHYPTLSNVNLSGDNKLIDDLRVILTVNRPYASELAPKWDITLNEGHINLPNREVKHISKDDFIEILHKRGDIEEEAYLMKYHIEKALSVDSDIEKILRLYACNDILTEEDFKLFQKLDYQLFSN